MIQTGKALIVNKKLMKLLAKRQQMSIYESK